MWRPPNWEELKEERLGLVGGDLEDSANLLLEALKDIVEYRQGIFMARFPEDANMAVIYKERLPDLFISKEELNA